MSNLDAVQKYWGDEMPNWVFQLAQECDATSQNKVAKRMGRSASLVNQVLRNKYTGSLHTVEDLVRGIYMAGTIICPALGTLPTHKCLEWRKKAKNFAGSNALRVRMYRACSDCPRNHTGD